MLTTIEKLSRQMPPPKQPFDATGDWNQIEESIGTPLPADYKEFISLYGTGAIGEWPLWVFNGLASNYKGQCQGVAIDYQTLFADSPRLQTYPLFPSMGGLLFCGATGNGDYIHWLTNGHPDDWKVVVLEFSLIEFIPVEDTLCDFIAKLISQEYDFVPKVLFEPPVQFTPTKLQFAWPERR